MWMKYETGCPYILHEHFDSPLWSFLEDKENKETIDSIIEKWITPQVLRYRLKTPEDYFFETMTIAQIWLPYENRKDWIYVSWMYLIIRRIVEEFISKLSKPIESDPVIKLLNGYMFHEYFSIGTYWTKIFDYMDEFSEKKEKKIQPSVESIKIINTRNEIIPLYLEEVSKRKDFEYELRVGIILDKIGKNKKIVLLDEDFDAIRKVWGKWKISLKVSKEWIEFAKRAGLSEEQIKWLKQIRIERWTNFTMTLLTAIITNIYFKKDLLLYYNPYMYEMGICDKKSLELNRPDVYLVVDFWKIINMVFCEHCIKKFIWKTKIDLSKNTQNKEAIKEMFNDLFSLVSETCPDDLSVKVEGKVKNTNRYSEINDILKFGKVWHDKYNGEKESIVFSVDKELKAYKKKII